MHTQTERSRTRHGDSIDWRWEARNQARDFEESRAKAILRHVPPRSRVLEIGVGGGHVVSELHRRAGCQCVGIDVLPSALSASRERVAEAGATVWLVQGSGFALPFGNAVFDCVLSLGVIEHYPPERARAMLREHARVCRPGGHVIVGVPNSLDVMHTARRRWLGQKYPYSPERSYTRWGLARELRGEGLTPIAHDGYALLWSLRQSRLAYPLTAALHKLGLLKRLGEVENPLVLSLLGNLTLEVARKPTPNRPTGATGT